AAAPAVEARKPEPLQRDVVTGLRAGRNLDLAIAVERRRLDRPAEHRPRGGDLDARDEIVADALEALVLNDGHLDVQVTGRGAGVTGVPGARDTDPLTGLDPGRDIDLPHALAHDPPAAVANLARRL